MRGGAALFVVVLMGAAAGWSLAVRPVQAEVAAQVRPAEASGDSVLSIAAAETLATALRARAGVSTPPPGLAAAPAGIVGRSVAWRGSVAWEAVPEILRWTTTVGDRLVSVTIEPDPAEPGRAACRIVLGGDDE